MLATVLGEIVGLGGAGILAGLSAALAPADPGFVLTGVLFTLMLAAGFGEGCVVGFAQSRVLRDALVAVPARAWIAATGVGALLAWALGSAVFTTLIPNDAAFEDHLPLLAGTGIACGTILGVAQWTVLRGRTAGAGWWIVANAVGWTLGLAVAFGVPMAITEGTPVLVVIPLALLTGAGTGLAPGLVTGLMLDRLVSRAHQ